MDDNAGLMIRPALRADRKGMWPIFQSVVALWRELGFEIVGTLPKVFRHRERGLVEAYVMYRFL
jgi:hypothetical protein